MGRIPPTPAGTPQGKNPKMDSGRIDWRILHSLHYQHNSSNMIEAKITIHSDNSTKDFTLQAEDYDDLISQIERHSKREEEKEKNFIKDADDSERFRPELGENYED